MAKLNNIYYNKFSNQTQLDCGRHNGVTHHEFTKMRQLFCNKTGLSLIRMTADAERDLCYVYTPGYLSIEEWTIYNNYLAGIVDSMRSY